MRAGILIALTIAVLTALGYFVFPGHTYLQSDTQIYIPMLERLWNPSVLQRDFMVERPHMALTVYDEVAVALRRWTGLGFREVLTAQQLLFRALGILGIYLIARSFRLGRRMSLLVAGIFALGATIWGPTVLTVEYEPVPRGFALPLTLLALGFLSRGWYLAAGAAASLAVLYHGTTALPFCLCYLCLLMYPAERRVRLRRLAGLLPLFGAAVILAALSMAQADAVHRLPFLQRLPPWWEQTLRLRATYIWVSLWLPRWYWHYAILAAVSAAALWRLRKEMNPDLRVPLLGLPLLGILSVPVSYLMLEVSKLALAPQLQPLRAVLFLTLAAALLSSVAGIHAAQTGRRWEAFAWFLAAFAIPTGDAVQDLLLPDLSNSAIVRRVLLVMLLAALAAAVAWAGAARRRWALPAWAAALLAPFLLYPAFGRVENYPKLDRTAVDRLARWARASTGTDAVFLFPDAGRALHPGVFRAEALRALYVDWKGGGQANYSEEVAREWGNRWQAVLWLPFKRESLRRFSDTGVDYVVLSPAARLDDETPLYENSSFLVYRAQR
ncbi:MAG TPA: DUF6798 domain-containing protein [Bryobacteraceae bacterium]|nr:DUF6798 domain-containing protein [Bryobacteraceae bacterium]